MIWRIFRVWSDFLSKNTNHFYYYLSILDILLLLNKKNEDIFTLFAILWYGIYKKI